MTNGDDTITVAWNSTAWERAILARPDIGSHGVRDGARRWLLFTPRRLLVDQRAARGRRVQLELRRRKAEPARGAAADVAARLGLTLLTVPRGDEVEAARAINEIERGAASVDHVWLPGPNRIHGDDLPVPTSDPGDVPGPDAAAGSGMTIVVLDTGIEQPQLLSVASDPQDAEVPDEDADKVRDPAAGHGTHVAGIVARGAPGATRVSRRLLTSPVGMASELDAADALLRAADDGADLINCSFGGPTDGDVPPPATAAALATILRKGVVVVAAAGNAGSARRNWPAAFEGVIAVGAVGRKGDGADWLQTDFSNHGDWVDCCAPGVAIASTFLHWPGGAGDPAFKGFATWTGTSFACPQVTAAIAAHAAAKGISADKAAAELIDGGGARTIGSIGSLVV